LTLTLEILAIVVLFILFVFLITKVSGSRRRAIRDPYSEGLRFLIDGERDRAYQMLREAVKADPDNIDAYLKLGDLLRERGEPQRALRVHKELMLRPNLRKGEKPLILKSLVQDHIGLGQDSSAIMVLEELLKGKDSELWALEYLLPLYEKGELWDKAFEVRQKMAKLKRGDASADLALYKVCAGENWASKGELKRARSHFKEALKLNNKCAAAYFYLGESYQKEERWGEAVDWWKRLGEKIPQKGFIAFKKLEETLYRLGRFEEAIGIYQRILDKEPEQRETILALAEIYEKKGMLDEAIALCEKFKLSFREVSVLLAKLYGQRGEPARSQEVIEELLEKERKDRVFVCRWCGHRSTVPLWRCPQCQRWRGFGI
jgi:lipopolysaccharide biosynthesis regulator YciM